MASEGSSIALRFRLGRSRARWALIAAWLAYEVAIAIPAWALLGPIIKAEWVAVFAALAK